MLPHCPSAALTWMCRKPHRSNIIPHGLLQWEKQLAVKDTTDAQPDTTSKDFSCLTTQKLFRQSNNATRSRRSDCCLLVYNQLLLLARQRQSLEKSGNPFDSCDLVHDAYLRLKADGRQWDNPGGKPKPRSSGWLAQRR